MSRKPPLPLAEITAQLRILSRRIDDLGARIDEPTSPDGRSSASMVGNSWSLDPDEAPPVPRGRCGP